MRVQLDSPDIMRIGQGLAEAGSIMALVLLTVCVGGEIYVWARHGNALSFNSRRVSIYFRQERCSFTDEVTPGVDGKPARKLIPRRQTRVLLPCHVQCQFCKVDMEPSNRIHGRVSVHGFDPGVCWFGSVCLGWIHY